MGGVDKGDHIREQGGGFGKGILVKKKFMSIILRMLNFGYLNAYIVWNMNDEVSIGHYELIYFEFPLILAEDSIQF